jgi:phosphatidylglycerophosphate synthase
MSRRAIWRYVRPVTQPWAEIATAAPAGELPATAVVGGIPLVIRQLRQLGRLGWGGARVLVDDAAAEAAVRAALARHPVPALAVEVMVATGPPARVPDARLDGRAIYRAADLAPASAARVPEPLLRVRTRADAADAERALYAQIRKTVEGDGFFAHYMIRPLTRPLCRALLGTRVSPNQVTAAALLCALAAALLAASGGAVNAALAGLLYWTGNALDCVDGDLARLRLQSTKLGEWLDSMTDEISTFSLLAGLGIGLWRDGAGAQWLWIGAGGSAVGAIAVACLYVDLHRMGMPIDTAQFPWFFTRAAQSSGPAPPARRSVAGTVLHALGYLVRRDANVTGVSLMLLFDWREVATALVAAGAAAGALVTLTHYLVMAMRPGRPV